MMANELQFYGLLAQTGLTVVARIYDDTGAQVGGDVACPENGSTAVYVGDMPSVAAGQYAVRFVASGEVVGTGEINWSGSEELSPAVSADPTSSKLDELHLMRGLDPANPVTVTTTEETAGGITLDIGGDGINSSTLTRQP